MYLEKEKVNDLMMAWSENLLKFYNTQLLHNTTYCLAFTELTRRLRARSKRWAKGADATAYEAALRSATRKGITASATGKVRQPTTFLTVSHPRS